MSSVVESSVFWPPATPRIIGLYVRQFKNLADIWLPWSSRIVLLGQNGVGKSNLLDCCALLMGTDQTKRLVERRVPKDLDYDISVMIAGAVIQPGPKWWNSLESNGDESIAGAVSRAAARLGAGKRLQRTITNSCSEGVVRFRLQSHRGNQQRTTTIVTKDAVDRLTSSIAVQGSPDLPNALMPMTAQWLAEHPKGADRFLDVVALPSTDDVPVDLQWLPYSRTEREIIHDFNECVLDAAWQLGVRWNEDGDDKDDVSDTMMGFLANFGTHWDHNDVLKRVVEPAAAAGRLELSQTMPSLAHLDLVWRGIQLDDLDAYVGDQEQKAAVAIEFEPESHRGRIVETNRGLKLRRARSMSCQRESGAGLTRRCTRPLSRLPIDTPSLGSSRRSSGRS